MNYHHLQLVSDEGEAPRLRLVCTAPPDAFCRKRPKEDRETWDNDSDLEPGRKCLWVEWAEDGGWDTIQAEEEGVLLSAPVDIYYDEGPVISIAEHVECERGDAGKADISPKLVDSSEGEPTDAEVKAAARAIDPEAWETDLSEERGADRHMIRGRRGQAVTLARAALVAAREVRGR